MTVAVAEAQPDLSTPQRIERFIEGQPPTAGVFEGSLATADNGIYISPSVMTPELGEHGLEVVNVEMLPGAQLGTGDSHHEVAFGKAAVQVGDAVVTTGVAIKPFTTESERAGHEHDQLVRARELGFDTFVPLAVARDGEVTYLITELRSEIESRDNVNWTISPADTERYEAEVVPELAFMADSMAQMHAKGVFHGDAQAKNIAKTDTGSMVVIDLEDATIVEGSEAITDAINGDYALNESLAIADVWHAWYQLIHPVTEDSANLFLEGEPFETCMAVFERDYLNPYLSSLEKHAPAEVHAGLKIEELRTLVTEKVARTT